MRKNKKNVVIKFEYLREFFLLNLLDFIYKNPTNGYMVLYKKQNNANFI